MRTTALVSTLCLAAATAAPVLAQQATSRTAAVTGFVTGDGGQPLTDVVVRVEGGEEQAVTDWRGRYVLPVPSGPLTLRFGRLGWQEATGMIDARAGETVRLDMRLSVDPVRLAGVAVLSDRSRLVGGGARWLGVPGAAHVVGPERLKEERRMFEDVHAVLRQVPGVNVQDEEGFGLRANIGIRGTGVERSSKVAVLEDGVLAAPAPYAAPAAYYFPVLGRMEAVEVRKGSSQIEYGPWTTGGAVNLVSSPVPEDFALRADVAGGDHATRRVHVRIGDRRGRFGYLAETYQVETDGFKRLDGGGDTGFDVKDFMVKLRAGTDPEGRLPQELELKLGYTDERSNETYLGLTEAGFAAEPLRRYAASQRDVMNAEHRQIQLRHTLRLSRRMDVTTTAYRNGFARNWYKLQSVAGRSPAAVLADPGRYGGELAVLEGAESAADALRVRANNREYDAYGVQTVAAARFGAGAAHDVAVGLRWHRDAEDRFQHEDGYRMAGGRMERTSAGAPGSQDNRVSEAEAWAGFASLRLRHGGWVVAPGVRFERVRFTRTDYAKGDAAREDPTRVRENGVDVWVPGIGITGRLTSSVSVFGGVHKGFGPPGPGADAGARAEESINYEAGARLLHGSIQLQAAVFLNDYRNILGRATLAVGETGTGDLFNGGAVMVKGVEFSAEYEPLSLRSLRFPMRLAYTFTDARFANSFESSFEEWGEVEAGDRLPYLPTHQLALGARAAAHRWSIGLNGAAASRMRTVAGHGEVPPGSGTDAYFVLGASAEFHATRGATIHAGLQNALDARYIVARRPAGARPGLPRTVSVGVQVTVR